MRSSFLVLVAMLVSPAAQAAPRSASSCQTVDDDYGPPGKTRLKVEVVADGLRVPWGLAFLPDRSMLITERAGRISRIANGTRSQVAQVRVTKSGEGGLLGLALHPDFARTHLFYVYYTADTSHGPRNRVERWRLSDDLASATADRVIVDDIPAARFHDGGRIAFGPDRMLYIGTGDATEPRSAQDPASLAGKILRVTGDGTIPSDNPTKGSPVFISGVRNVEAFDWDDHGALAIAEHGPSGELGRSGHDRVFLVRDPAGANLGWPRVYGCQTREGFATPALTWVTAVPPGGAAFYRDGSIRAWRGELVIGTLGSHHLHRVRFGRDGRVVAHHTELSDRGRLRTVAIGPDGELYVMTSNCDGRGECPRRGDAILRITQ
ncbi:MAG TPA: PQQ-dependent sugar dehydrogenase [Kofleriaceae bacterium]|nr:PQQ-dependent sugar dehydrogenase [Kofleriaceae bacterium]